MSTYSPRIRGPLVLVRDRDVPVRLEIWSELGLVEPTSVELTVYDADDSVVVDALALTVGSDLVAAGTVTAATLPTTLDLSPSWRAEWAVTVGGEDHIWDQAAMLVRRPWVPTVTQADLLAACPQLRNAYSVSDQADMTALSDIVRAAAEDLQCMLAQDGRRPQLIVDGHHLNRHLVLECLSRIFRGAMYDTDPANLAAVENLAKAYEDKACASWDAMNFRYDGGETGKAGDAQQAQAPARVRMGMTR